MRVPQKSQSLSRFNNLKATLQKATAKPSNEALFKQDGDRFELTRDVSMPLDGQNVVVKKGSAFDNDIKTRDTITVQSQEGGVVQSDKFEHFSEKRGFIFKRDQEMLEVTYSDRQGMNFSNNSITFEV